jgi:uncharacterized membrane protein YhaH (DUF805 family)
MTLLESLRSCLLDNFATGRGRASRSEYWWFQLCVLVVMGFWPMPFDAGIMGEVPVLPSLTSLLVPLLVALALLIPSSSVTIRRLHDIDKSGLWLLLGLVPLVGMILILVYTCRRGTPGQNRFGPDPRKGGPATR